MSMQKLENTNDENIDSDITVKIGVKGFFAILIPLVFISGIAVGYIWRGRSIIVGIANDLNRILGPGTAPKEQVYDVSADNNPARGPENAPVTIVEFSDYQCPYCTAWHKEVYGKLLENYGDQIRFVYRDFPLAGIHSEAFPAAEAANCAGEQGHYWPYHDMLFDGGPDTLGIATYLAYAKELSLDMTQFQVCMDDHRYADEVQADYDYALGLGLQSTPTFFINGIIVVGAQPYEIFEQKIESALANQK